MGRCMPSCQDGKSTGMYAGTGVLAVVCPGRDTALPVTGRRWHRTVLSSTRRDLLHLHSPVDSGLRHAACGRLSNLPSAAMWRMYRMIRTRAHRAQQAHSCAFRTALSATLLPLMAVITSPWSGRAKNDKRYRHHHPTSQTLSPACRYLSFKFQTIQSCSPAHGPIATAVQPWCAQECTYTFLKSRSPGFRFPSNLH